MWRRNGGQAEQLPQRRKSDLFARPSAVELPRAALASTIQGWVEAGY